jgi:predicted nicotinamide N-methyase
MACAIYWGSKVVLTDMAQFVPKLESNVNVNLTPTEQSLVQCREVFWGRPISPSVLNSAPFDLIVVSDCIYHPDLFQPLIDTIASLATENTSVWIGHQVRRKGDKAFWKLMRKQFNVTELELATNANGKIHLYEAVMKPLETPSKLSKSVER